MHENIISALIDFKKKAQKNTCVSRIVSTHIATLERVIRRSTYAYRAQAYHTISLSCEYHHQVTL